MHASTDPRLLKCIEGITFSFEMLGHAYEGLHTACCAITQEAHTVIPPLTKAWAFIDALHRIREVAQAIPGLSGRDPGLRAFLDATALAEDYRHYIQHLRQELSKSVPDAFPVWGALSWVDAADPNTSYTVIMGVQLPGTEFPGAVWDTLRKRWVSKVSLSIRGVSFHFDAMHQATGTFHDFIIPWLLATYKLGLRTTSSVAIVAATYKDEP